MGVIGHRLDPRRRTAEHAFTRQQVAHRPRMTARGLHDERYAVPRPSVPFAGKDVHRYVRCADQTDLVLQIRRQLAESTSTLRPPTRVVPGDQRRPSSSASRRNSSVQLVPSVAASCRACPPQQWPRRTAHSWPNRRSRGPCSGHDRRARRRDGPGSAHVAARRLRPRTAFRYLRTRTRSARGLRRFGRLRAAARRGERNGNDDDAQQCWRSRQEHPLSLVVQAREFAMPATRTPTGRVRNLPITSSAHRLCRSLPRATRI